ncbi:MAG: hypothetical protein COU42_00740 [Candidatus Nealsonbacteria bacterium CG10_big_fil_rev_8_21_14_0_10_36_24]|uniref:Uncharacterized protein n=1 Tax=Candidatus Nealsonbacteria bacterium CG10_big_fil_rev_8_21_14_0_10_36_24 TaxID=1974710 RepID=A0A2M6NTA6_9BACT|nr:MAG: hypothetical protein COU42_00740 [Candidatus Nealsonbacteria bacterium CG10_big_fil_rev_8_21_14_0_10_36_24]
MSIGDLLAKYNLKYEDLNINERETLQGWLENLASKEITLDRVKDYIREMISGVETELSECDLNRKKDIFLKSRLRNYLLLLAFLESPEKAKQALEKQLKNIKK